MEEQYGNSNVVDNASVQYKRNVSHVKKFNANTVGMQLTGMWKHRKLKPVLLNQTSSY